MQWCCGFLEGETDDEHRYRHLHFDAPYALLPFSLSESAFNNIFSVSLTSHFSHTLSAPPTAPLVDSPQRYVGVFAASTEGWLALSVPPCSHVSLLFPIMCAMMNGENLCGPQALSRVVCCDKKHRSLELFPERSSFFRNINTSTQHVLTGSDVPALVLLWPVQ